MSEQNIAGKNKHILAVRGPLVSSSMVNWHLARRQNGHAKYLDEAFCYMYYIFIFLRFTLC